MRHLDFQIAFELGINKFDDPNKPTTRETEFWLNQALMRYVTTRYTGTNYHQLSFEQSQKRIDDLRRLVRMEDLSVTKKADSNSFLVEIPENCLYVVGERAYVIPNEGHPDECWPKDENGNYIPTSSDVVESTIEEFDQKLRSPLSEHHKFNGFARPIRLFIGDKIMLTTDGTYDVTSHELTYLTIPQRIDIHNKPHTYYIDLPEHTHQEIVNVAIQLYLEKSVDPRFQSHTALIAAEE